MTKTMKITISVIAAVVVALGTFLGLYFGLKDKTTFQDDIHNLMNGVKMTNENVIGFSTIKEDDIQTNVTAQDTSSQNLENALMCVNERFELEKVSFKKFANAEEVTLEDIAEYGAITQFYVMNNFLFIQITSNNVDHSDEVKEDSYFTMTEACAIFVVDLESKNVFSLRDIELFFDHYLVEFDLSYGLIELNLAITNLYPKGYYALSLKNDKLFVEKVADEDAYLGGHLLQDKYGNRYLVDDGNFEMPDLNKVNMDYFSGVVGNFEEYEYFLSSDKVIYRAKKDSHITETNKERYSNIESLKEDSTWSLETSTSDKILRKQLTFSESFQGGDWMLIEGNIIRIVDTFTYASNICYNVDGRILSHLRTDEEETVLSIADVDGITLDSEYIDFYHDGYSEYEKIVSEPVSDAFGNFSISITRIGTVLTGFTDTVQGKYKIVNNNGNIELQEIKPNYNGVEVLSEIIFLN